MSLDLEEFYHDFRQNLLSGAEAREDFLEAEFMLIATKELVDSGTLEGFEGCHYKAPRGMRVDGYWYNDDNFSIDLFIVDFSNRESIETITKTDIEAFFKRLENFFTASVEKALFRELEETSPGYGLARDIFTKAYLCNRVNFYLISERKISDKVAGFEEKKYGNLIFNYNIWDITRLYRLCTSKEAKEELVINLGDMVGKGIQCLPANIGANEYQSFLMVMPAAILAELYSKHGDRLLEQNIRCYLQARGKINKGIRGTILNEPEMFFAYNNGITATAREVITDNNSEGMYITKIRDLQIVNGGQTSASIFHASHKDKAPLDKIFVQVKLTIVDKEMREEVIPRISEYANTQNKVNAADFFSNHPFHMRMEEYSRRLWAPVIRGAARESKWFYERARGQYANAQSGLSQADKKRFLSEFPKNQVFTKTDLGKFDNVWDEKPTFVCHGAQKNFVQYARRIGAEWSNNPDGFNEFYYNQAISRAILFKCLEKLIPQQSWYSGDYRAQIIAYTFAMISALCDKEGKSFNFTVIWDAQDINEVIKDALLTTAKLVHDDIMKPPSGISNISEWCKKEACWERLQDRIKELKSLLTAQFLASLIPKDNTKLALKSTVV